ncbi:MAG: contractile injection system protein, VgrG/Pvc8 family [Nitrospira sp.]|nr:contractile injection system protein, VgrG/Pvc8 family [Nitrospira sp.]
MPDSGLLVPVVDVFTNGRPLAPEVELMSVTVDDTVDLPGMFVMEILNSDAASGEWILDQQQFAVGNEVEIKLGYADGGNLASVMKGEITGMEVEFTWSTLPKVTVRGYDRRHRLQRGRKSRTFVKQTDSDIAKTIAQEAGLSANTKDSRVQYDYVLQANQTDMEFLLERAGRIQYDLTIDDETLNFLPVANAEGSLLTLTLKDDLMEFSSRLSSIGQVDQRIIRGWDPKQKKSLVGVGREANVTTKMGGARSGAAVATRAFGAATGTTTDSPVMTQAEADAVAKAAINASVLGFITGEGLCAGRTDLRAGKVITLGGLGKQFSGQYYVTAVSHRCREGGYTTRFTVRRNAV